MVRTIFGSSWLSYAEHARGDFAGGPFPVPRPDVHVGFRVVWRKRCSV